MEWIADTGIDVQWNQTGKSKHPLDYDCIIIYKEEENDQLKPFFKQLQKIAQSEEMYLGKILLYPVKKSYSLHSIYQIILGAIPPKTACIVVLVPNEYHPVQSIKISQVSHAYDTISSLAIPYSQIFSSLLSFESCAKRTAEFMNSCILINKHFS